MVYRFFAQPDFLRVLSNDERSAWCEPERFEAIPGGRFSVQVKQRAHSLRLELDVETAAPGEALLYRVRSWPCQGARWALYLSEQDGATSARNETEWAPPWYMRRAVDRRADEIASELERRLSTAKTIVEAVFAQKGTDAFSGPVAADCRDAGFAPTTAE